jgi:very-short-patch-repair endonuclease
MGDEDMKDYVNDIWNKNKEKSYNIFKKNQQLVVILENIYGNQFNFITKIQLYMRDLNDLPICEYSKCDTQIQYKRGKFSICCSKKCHNLYLKENNLFGDINKKRKNTLIEKYGVEHQMQIPEVKEKISQTNLERYGTESYTKSEDYKIKTKKTSLEKYGLEFHTQSCDTKNKIHQSYIEKYGSYYTQTDDFKQKAMITNINKFGHNHPMQSEEIKEKLRKTINKKYGVDNFPQSDKFKEICEHNNYKKYGISNPARLHFNKDMVEIFNNKDLLEYLLNQYGIYKLSELINCDPSTIYRYTTLYSINLPPRTSSHQEENISDFLNEQKINVITNSRRILPSGKELDFYFPDHNLAIEINGLYWHSEISGGKDRKYHYNKWKECNDLGITLLSIQEDEFNENKQFWFNKILYMTGNMKPTKIHARKCEIRELDNVTKFLNEHHLQGSCASSYKFGLFYDDNLVSVMTFSNTRNNDIGIIELSRFCNNSGYLVSGGASKLLSHFIKKYGHPYKSIISFSDNNYSNGKVYKSIGFKVIHNLKPDYQYIIKGKRHHKTNFRKSSIFKKFDIPDDMKNKSEWELMQYLGYDRIWDTGKKKWEMKI